VVEKEKPSKIKLLLTRIMSWKPILVIFLFILLGELIFGSKITLSYISATTLFFTILYHLLISLPSSILADIENKILKVFLHLVTLFILFIMLAVFVGGPIYEQVQEDERRYNSGQGYTILKPHKQEAIRVK
jgi:hypothetical protein